MTPKSTDTDTTDKGTAATTKNAEYFRQMREAEESKKADALQKERQGMTTDQIRALEIEEEAKKVADAQKANHLTRLGGKSRFKIKV
tara:strand:+ start:159 stop:419 length:261 start_codon:yes stop_codon:yes gene_type:complete